MVKSTNYYLQIIEEETGKVFGMDKKRLSTAVRTLKTRTVKNYEWGVITLEEAAEVLKWLNRIH